jgi:hypothetical protein
MGLNLKIILDGSTNRVYGLITIKFLGGHPHPKVSGIFMP